MGREEPSSALLNPFWIALFPDVKIIHVIRDGRDMVLSKNQNQPRKHFEALFAETYRGLRTQSAKFWARSNYQVAKLASENPGSIYTIKIEDLCGQEKHKRIADVCEFTATTLAAAGDELLPFSAQPSFGRGHQIDINNYPSEFKEALKHFGYI